MHLVNIIFDFGVTNQFHPHPSLTAAVVLAAWLADAAWDNQVLCVNETSSLMSDSSGGGVSWMLSSCENIFYLRSCSSVLFFFFCFLRVSKRLDYWLRLANFFLLLALYPPSYRHADDLERPNSGQLRSMDRHIRSYPAQLPHWNGEGLFPRSWFGPIQVLPVWGGGVFKFSQFEGGVFFLAQILSSSFSFLLMSSFIPTMNKRDENLNHMIMLFVGVTYHIVFDKYLTLFTVIPVLVINPLGFTSLWLVSYPFIPLPPPPPAPRVKPSHSRRQQSRSSHSGLFGTNSPLPVSRLC